MKFSFRNIEKTDFSEVCKLPQTEEELFFMFPKANFPLTQEQLVENLKTRFNPTVFLDDNVIIGFANFYEMKENESCWIGNLILQADYRRKGIGRLIVQTMEEQAKLNYNMREINIACFNNNLSALRMYHRLGYTPFEMEERSGRNDTCHVLIKMKKRIEEKKKRFNKNMQQKITIQNGKIHVPNCPKLPYIEGDGVGQEIWKNAQKVIDKAVEKAYNGERKIEWKEVLAGEKSFNQNGSWLPDETMSAFREYLVGIKGPLTTPVGGGIRSLNVALRQDLDLYACVRPVRWFKGVPSPIKTPEKVNMTIFRENTEDIYAGIEWMQGTPEAKKFLNFLQTEMGVKKVRFPETSSFGIKPVSVEGTERLVRSAIEYALANNLPSVTLVHKGNIMKFTEGGFKLWGYALAEREYSNKVFTMQQWETIKKEQGETEANNQLDNAKATGKLIIKDVIADAFLQNTLLKPAEYSVIATLNLNGDYISDQLAAMVGGIGIAPGANINYKTGHAIFEATHGTAPDIAGKNIVNPSSVLLSSVMMLEYMEWNEAATLITNGLERLYSNGKATADLARFMENGQTLSTSEFSDLLVNEL